MRGGRARARAVLRNGRSAPRLSHRYSGENLKIRSDLVGTKLKGLEREVSWRDTMNYAAAVADLNPAYLDDTRPDGIVAPPLFAVAVTWPLMQDMQNQLGDAIDPEIFTTMVHASEHLSFHRPIRPGDRLKVSGSIAAIVPSRAGAKIVLRLDAVDDSGKPVFTEHAGAVFRGVSCIDGGSGADSLPVAPVFDQPAPARWERELFIAPQAAHVYDGCTGIFFAIHTSKAFARMVGLPDILMQGTAILATAAREMVNAEAAADPCRLAEIGCRFTGMVRPGTAIRIRSSERRDSDGGASFGFQVFNEIGQVALRDGHVKFIS